MEEYTDDMMRRLWLQSKRELEGFADHLESRKMGITASQMRLACQMAQREYDRLTDTADVKKN